MHEAACLEGSHASITKLQAWQKCIVPLYFDSNMQSDWQQCNVHIKSLLNSQELAIRQVFSKASLSSTRAKTLPV